MRVLGVEGYPYGFVTTDDGRTVVSFAYASRPHAEAAATHLESALLFPSIPPRDVKREAERTGGGSAILDLPDSAASSAVAIKLLFESTISSAHLHV